MWESERNEITSRIECDGENNTREYKRKTKDIK